MTYQDSLTDQRDVRMGWLLEAAFRASTVAFLLLRNRILRYDVFRRCTHRLDVACFRWVAGMKVGLACRGSVAVSSAVKINFFEPLCLQAQGLL